MHVEGRSVVALFAELAARGVQLRLLHAELPSRPFRASFEKRRRLWDKLELKICPRVHFKAVIVDKAWLYLGSANLTGAGLGAKGEGRRNFELGICTEDFDTIDRVSALFEAVWSGAECGACRLRPGGSLDCSAVAVARLGTLDTGLVDPKRIDLVSGPEITASGIYEFDGDRLTLRSAPRQQAGVERSSELVWERLPD